jgi:YHS domain-containing protein
MLMNRWIWAAGAVLLLAPLQVRAAEPVPALDGNCPVCLVEMDRQVQGDSSFRSTYDGQTYWFPSAKMKDMFDENPSKYVPVLRGNCTVCKVESNKDVPGKVEHHLIHNGRLYLFPSPKQQSMFEANPAKYADADLALGGKCPVCLVKAGKIVPGKAAYFSIYDGSRYLFPTPEQKKAFDADPAAFAPALGGKCAVCKVESNKDVPGTAAYHYVYNGRLYLFPSAGTAEKFRANPAKYADADLALGGDCVVCKVDMGRKVPGRSDWTLDWRGERYLFAGREQLEKFRANPTKYEIR